MTKQTLLIIAGAVIIFGGGLWLGSIRTVEAPSVVETVATNSADATTDTNTIIDSASTTLLTNDTAQAALKAPTSLPKPTPKPAVTTKPAYTLVTYDGEHFTPKAVTILKGGTVRYLNLSNNSLWVASNLHPVHTGYPVRSQDDCAGSTFDMCKAIDKGESWDFKFDREGTWKYHNHKSPRDEGEVEVNLPGDKPSVPGY